MRVTVELPDEIAQQLGSNAEMPRRILEAIALQRYLAEEISLSRLGELLGLDRWEAESFLDKHNARLPYTQAMPDRAASDGKPALWLIWLGGLLLMS